MLHGYNIFVWWELLRYTLFSSVQFSSVAQSCLTLWDPMNCSTPGLPVHHQLPEFTQTHAHRISDAIQPSHPLSPLPPPAPGPPRIRVFSNESALLMLLLLLLSHFSRVRLCATPSLGFSRQEHWSELPFPSPMHKSEKWKWIRSVMSDSSWPMDCSLPGSSIHGLFQARVLEWGAIAFSDSSHEQLSNTQYKIINYSSRDVHCTSSIYFITQAYTHHPFCCC